MSQQPFLAPNGRMLHTQSSIEQRQAGIMSAVALARQSTHETASTDSGYAMPVTSSYSTAGSSPAGFGYTFGDSFRRTGKDVMEFNDPVGQAATIDTSLKIAMENSFIAKALRIKTDFTTRGLTNRTSDEKANAFFDSVADRLNMVRQYKWAVWMYYAIGLVPILLPTPETSLSFIDILDPRIVRIARMFGKYRVFVVPDIMMINACKDPTGKSAFANKVFYEMMPPSWRAQINAGLIAHPNYNPTSVGMNGEMLIELVDGEFSVIENRYNSISRRPQDWDGAPLQPYFHAAEHYRQLMAGDFATGFVAKNLIAIVSVGDPAAEGDNYQRPDQNMINGLASSFQTPNRATWYFGDKTTHVEYVTPDPATWTQEKYKMPLEELKNLLPSPFWFGSDGSFSGSSVEIKQMREEANVCNDEFDRMYWKVIYQRAANDSPIKIAKKNMLAPFHDQSSLVDDAIFLQKQQQTYNNGGLSIRTLVEENGYDFDAEKARKEAEMADIKKNIWMPNFEPSQGIVASVLYEVPSPPGEQSAPSPEALDMQKQQMQSSERVQKHSTEVNADVSKHAARQNTKVALANGVQAPAPVLGSSNATRANQGKDGGTGGRPSTGKSPQSEPGASRAPRPGSK